MVSRIPALEVLGTRVTSLRSAELHQIQDSVSQGDGGRKKKKTKSDLVDKNLKGNTIFKLKRR